MLFAALRYVLITSIPAGLAILMAMVNLVQKWKASATYQSHIYELFDLKFGKDYHVTRFTNFAKFGKDRVSGSSPTWW